MSRERDIALHGALVVRLVDRMMQFRFDRAKVLFGGELKDEDELPEGLSRFDEATALAAIVQAAKFVDLPYDYSTRNSDDAGAYFRLYGLKAGHVLTENDVADLEALLAELNDEIGHQAEKHVQYRIATIREIGGDELVAAIEAKDEALINASVAGAMEKFRQQVSENQSSREVAGH